VANITVADASELVSELTAPAPSEAFSLFRVQEDGSKKEFKLRLRMLREEETISALKEAQAYAKQNGEINKTEYGDIYKEAQACAVLAKSLCHAEQKTFPNGTKYYPQLFVDTKQLRASFTESEMAVCLNALEVLKAKYRCYDEWSDQDLDRWAERLSDAFAGPLWLGRLDSAHWPDLIYGLARRLVALGPPPETSPTSSESEPATSDDGTGGSAPLPHVQLPDGQKLPEETLLTKSQADEIAKRMREKK
jgi:hypothetical protein